MKDITTRENKGLNGLTENRAIDHHNEEFFRTLLDDTFYCNIEGLEFERMLDKENQLKGIDLVGQLNGDNLVIDEKVQTSKAFVPEARKRSKFTYSRDGQEITVKTACTPTFCFELMCSKMAKRQRETPQYNTYGFSVSPDVFGSKKYPGWFLDAKKETKQYVCVWPHNLNEIEIMMINRADLLNALKKKGLTDETVEKALWDIQADAAEAMQNDNFKASKWKAPLRYYDNCLKNEKGEYDAWFTSSVYNLAEAPINLICRKDFLLSLPKTQHWMMFPRERELMKI